MTPVVIVLVGQIASGKGTVTAYLQKRYGASTYRFSTMLRDLLDRIHQDHTRENITKISEAIRQNFGEDVMAYTIAEDTKKDTSPIIVVDGARRPQDLVHLKTVPGYILVAVDASMETRYQRIIGRTENTDDQGKTFDQFVADHELPTEKTIASVMQEATETINNEGDETTLHNQIDALITKYT